MYEADKPNPFVGKWKAPFATTARPSISGQRQLLLEELHEASSVGPVLVELASTLRRLPEYLRTIRRYDEVQVPSAELINERGLQVLTHAILRLLYADVRAEDYVSQHAGAASRVDFLVAGVGVIVETKMTRPGLGDRKVGEELLIDWGRYKRHPECRAIFALIYDPMRFIDNPAAIESSLTDMQSEVPTMAVVVY